MTYEEYMPKLPPANTGPLTLTEWIRIYEVSGEMPPVGVLKSQAAKYDAEIAALKAESSKFRNDADKWYGKFVGELGAHKRCLELLRAVHACIGAREYIEEVDSQLAADIERELDTQP